MTNTTYNRKNTLILLCIFLTISDLARVKAKYTSNKMIYKVTLLQLIAMFLEVSIKV